MKSSQSVSASQTARSLTATRNGRLFSFGLLYFVQGALIAFVLVFNNLYLREFGASARQLATLNGMLVVPFILKVLIGLVSDRVSLFNRGFRIPYIRLGALLMGAGSLVLTLLHPVEQFALFAVVAIGVATGLAFYDTVTDGLAIDTTPPEEHGLIQGAMVMGRSIGLVALASIYGRLIESLGWTVVFWIMAAFCIIPFIVLLRLQENENRPVAAALDAGLWTSLRRPSIKWLACYAVVYSFVVYGANGIVALFLREGLGSGIVQIGDAAAIGGFGMLAGAALATLIARRVSIWQQGTVTIFGVSLALSFMVLFTSTDNIASTTFLWGIFLATAEFVYVTLAMMQADPRYGAATFALFMAISNASTGVGQAFTTGLIDTIDFRWIFAAMAIVNLVQFPLLRRLKHTTVAEWSLRAPPAPTIEAGD